MQYQQNYSLKQYNTFALDSHAKYFLTLSQPERIASLVEDALWQSLPKFILGGGSNVIICEHYPGIVIKNNIKGIATVKEDDEHVWLRFGAGENWHSCVMYCLQHNLGGIENLSLIPGNIGAAPIQNIGAYGVELKDVFDSLTAIRLQDGSVKTFTHADCQFAYRDSIFKRELRGQYLIADVTLRLDKHAQLQLSYGGIQTELAKRGVTTATIHDVSNAVIALRQSKLPDPTKLPNAGSFFKNPIITQQQFQTLQASFDDIPNFPQANDTIKIPAGWLIERAGWKGKQVGNVGVSPNHALVIVNYGGADSSDIISLARAIQTDVSQKFKVDLHPEVQVVE